MTPTPEQLAIIEAATSSAANLAVIARAGTGKTSTLVLLAEALAPTPILTLAFNKAIAMEMERRLPPNCEAKTLHGLGYKAWAQFFRRRLTLDKGKVYRLTKTAITEWEEADERQALFDEFGDIMNFIRLGKSNGWIPNEADTPFRPLLTDEEFFAALPRRLTPPEEDIIKTVSYLSARENLQGTIDFDDMILAPALHPSVRWPSFPVTLIDEAQDLSPLNHHILRKLVRRDRIIAVGDPFQAIYGFRGASTQSMAQLIEAFDMQPHHLTVTFRCAASIVENARWRAEDLKAFDTTRLGEVRRPVTWSPDDLEPGHAIICRNNAPLLSMAIRLIKVGLLPELSSGDIGKMIEKVMKKLGKPATIRASALILLDEWKEKELRRATRDGAGKVHDLYACIRVVLNETDTIGDALAYLHHLLSREGRIHLMTGHKAKGLEFDTVWFLDPHLCKIKKEQDANLKYVIETRAKNTLSYVSSDSFEDEVPEEE